MLSIAINRVAHARVTVIIKHNYILCVENKDCKKHIVMSTLVCYATPDMCMARYIPNFRINNVVVIIVPNYLTKYLTIKLNQSKT